MSQLRSLRRILAVAVISAGLMLGSFAGVARAADDDVKFDQVIVCTLKWNSTLHKFQLDCRVVLVPRQ